MDYKAFYAEIADWIIQCNQMAGVHGFDSAAFWNWVTSSSSEMCKKYNDNDLVKKQMVMLYLWLDDVYEKSLGGVNHE